MTKRSFTDADLFALIQTEEEKVTIIPSPPTKKLKTKKKPKQHEVKGACLACRRPTCPCICWQHPTHNCSCPKRGHDGLFLPDIFRQDDVKALGSLLHHLVQHADQSRCQCRRGIPRIRSDVVHALRTLYDRGKQATVRTWITARIKCTTLRNVPEPVLWIHGRTGLDAWMYNDLSLPFEWAQLRTEDIVPVRNPDVTAMECLALFFKHGGGFQEVEQLPPLAIWSGYHPTPTQIFPASKDVYLALPQIEYYSGEKEDSVSWWLKLHVQLAPHLSVPSPLYWGLSENNPHPFMHMVPRAYKSRTFLGFGCSALDLKQLPSLKSYLSSFLVNDLVNIVIQYHWSAWSLFHNWEAEGPYACCELCG